MSSNPVRLPVPQRRRVVLVTGAGRSGSSLLAGALRALGMHVPQPEVPADAANPTRVGEPRWVVDFHTGLLARANVSVADARPTAWFETGKLNTFGPLRVELAEWLEQQFSAETPELVIKDPQLAWFLGLWRAATLRCDAVPAYVTMLRPVPEVVGSRRRTHTPGPSGSGFGEITATAGWVNLMLHTERSTRGSARAFVRFDDLVTDWTVPMAELGRALDLQAVQEASANHVRAVHAVVDPSLKQSTLTWDDLEVPVRLRELAEETWQALNKLGDPGGDTPDVHELLDELRAGYAELYDEAEAIAESTSAAAARQATSGGGPGPTDGAGSAGVRALVPARAKKGLKKALGRE